MQDGAPHRSRDPRRARKPTRSDEEARARAEALVRQGMPYQMAMSVAHGRIDLNEALERMARRDRVNGLMERHGLSRALATQIALGQADLEQVLARRRFEEHRELHRDRTCLVPDQPLALVLHDGRTLKGRVKTLDLYQFTFQADSGEVQALHKLTAMYGYLPDTWKQVKKGVKAGERGVAAPPAVRPQDRYSCSDKRLFAAMDKRLEVAATVVDGSVLRGTVEWFGKYEFGLRLRTEAILTVFRHALRDLAFPS